MEEIIGLRFGRGAIIERVENNDRGRKQYKLICDCSNTYITSIDNLRSGGTKSCGCLRDESRRNYKNPKTMPYGVASFYNLLRHYKIEAYKRNLEFDLSEEKFKELTKSNCFYCGIQPSAIYKRNHGNGEYIYNGIDRIDNNAGYVIGNVVPCCKACNFAKHEMSLCDFDAWVTRVYNQIKIRAIQDVR